VEKIISEIAGNFIKNICEKLILGKSLSQIENDSFSEPQKLLFTEFLNDWLNTIIINSVEKNNLGKLQAYD